MIVRVQNPLQSYQIRRQYVIPFRHGGSARGSLHLFSFFQKSEERPLRFRISVPVRTVLTTYVPGTY
jgi:hypothetical protein